MMQYSRGYESSRILIHTKKLADNSLSQSHSLPARPFFRPDRMALSLAPLPQPSTSLASSSRRRLRSSSSSAAYVIAAPSRFCSVPRATAGTSVDWSSSKGKSDFSIYVHGVSKKKEEFSWEKLEVDINYWTRPLRPVQWYPSHIAKTEKELKEQLKLMDVVIEVRDARIPLATTHPMMDRWLGNRRKILVLNREDMVSKADKNAWASYFTKQGVDVLFANGQLGMGTMKLGRLAKSLASDVNVKRRAKGLLPRPVRAGIVGYPNVGKSSLINRLLKRRMCQAAPRPGVTRALKWVSFGKDLELLDSPGILPMRISDQTAAIKLAICDDIGERSYDVVDVATILLRILLRLPTVGPGAISGRYKMDLDGDCTRTYLDKVALQLFGGDANQAAFRVLSDFRKGKFGWVALERPPR